MEQKTIIQRKNKFDLEERTAKFGEDTINLLKKVPRDEISRPLVSQLTRCSTSVGENYCEADDTVSSKDFKNKIGICKKESRESKHFFRMLIKAVPELREPALKMWLEAKELNLIFNSISERLRSKLINIKPINLMILIILINLIVLNKF